MAHFYSTIQGQAGEATRRGSKSSGIEVTAASWSGAVAVTLWHDERTGQDRYRVEARPWHGQGERGVLAEGVVGEAGPSRAAPACFR